MDESPKKNKIAAVLSSKKLSVVLAMGFASGLPFPLTHGTLQAFLTDFKLDTKTVGYISALVAYPYALKFIWAPLLDRYMPPLFGLRRGWILITQLALALSFILLGLFDPAESIRPFAAIAIMMSIISATQDIVIDAYRIEIVDERERGVATSYAVLGYRIALIVGNSLALVLADHYSWHFVYTVMAIFMLFGAAITLWSDEPAIHRAERPSFKDSFLLPLKDFLKKSHALEILAFVLLYKFGEILALALTTNFMLELGFTKTEIGVVTKGVGLAATILGTMVGGILMIKMSLKRSLWLFGIAQAVSIGGYLLLAHVGKNSLLMAGSIIAENFCLGMASSAFMAFLMGLCNTRFTATQYALLTSLIAFAHSSAPAIAGKMVASLGWEVFFVICMFSTIPGLLLLLRFDKWKSEA